MPGPGVAALAEFTTRTRTQQINNSIKRRRRLQLSANTLFFFF
jgi:hypothetical protein